MVSCTDRSHGVVCVDNDVVLPVNTHTETIRGRTEAGGCSSTERSGVDLRRRPSLFVAGAVELTHKSHPSAVTRHSRSGTSTHSRKCSITVGLALIKLTPGPALQGLV